MSDRQTAPSLLLSARERTLAAVVYGVSALVCLLIFLLVVSPQVFEIDGLDVSGLPLLHATLNGTTAVFLVLGYVMIRSGKVGWHRTAMVTAFTLSCLFLVSYLIYHSQAPDSHYGGEGWVRAAYFSVLISHIGLAPVVLPLALYTVVRAIRGEFPRHRRIARWTLPLWLYVAVTGVIVYTMMAPYYCS